MRTSVLIDTFAWGIRSYVVMVSRSFNRWEADWAREPRPYEGDRVMGTFNAISTAGTPFESISAPNENHALHREGDSAGIR